MYEFNYTMTIRQLVPLDFDIGLYKLCAKLDEKTEEVNSKQCAEWMNEFIKLKRENFWICIAKPNVWRLFGFPSLRHCTIQKMFQMEYFISCRFFNNGTI